MKASRKRLKVVLVSKIKNFGLAFIASKLVGFSLFDNFFLDLAKFQDLDIFSLFDFLDLNHFLDFLVCSISFLLISNLLTLLLLLFFSKTGLLLLFLEKADLLLLFLLGASLSNNLVIFSIKVNRAAILLKP